MDGQSHKIEPHHIGRVANMLGEGVLWDHRTEKVQWTDIEGQCFWQWDLGEGEPVRTELPERLGSFALTPDPAIYLGAFESGFAKFSVSRPMFEIIAPVTGDFAHLRMNDGRTDRQGNFWAGSMPEGPDQPRGALWRYGGKDAAQSFLQDIEIPNSLAWSDDGRTMYFADSPQNTIWAYDFDPLKGPVGSPRIFAKTPVDVHPDGSCVDAENCLWNAQWGAGEVVRYRPDGTVDRRLSLPVSQPSCVAFAGKNLNLLCVTTARVDLSTQQLKEEPLAGSLLVYKLDIQGKLEHICEQDI